MLQAGGRVICNELSRQKLMTRHQVVLDYKFTRDYLTPTHVNGYHCWASLDGKANEKRQIC